MSDRPSAQSHDDAILSNSARAHRASVMLIATVEQSQGLRATRHRVRNLSAGGVRIDNAAGLRAGATVLISIGVLDAVAATIKWAENGFAGLAFAEEINPEDARKKAAIPPCTIPNAIKASATAKVSAPTAGWIEELRNPYRK